MPVVCFAVKLQSPKKKIPCSSLTLPTSLSPSAFLALSFSLFIYFSRLHFHSVALACGPHKTSEPICFKNTFFRNLLGTLEIYHTPSAERGKKNGASSISPFLQPRRRGTIKAQEKPGSHRNACYNTSPTQA